MAQCSVSFALKDLGETGVENAVIEANILEPIESGTDYIPRKKVTATTDTNGDATLSLLQGATDVIITIKSPNGDGGVDTRQYSITVPNTATANFTDLIGA